MPRRVQKDQAYVPRIDVSRTEFTVPHGIAGGDDRRVYESDRFNRRIQVFDENGVFLDKWPSGFFLSPALP